MELPRDIIRLRHNSHQDIDEAATRVAAQSLAGVTPESDARWALAALVYGSDIPERVVRQATAGKGIPGQVVVDSADYVREQLTKMIAGANPRLDLSMVATGTSLCGWASRIIRGPMVFPKTDFDSRRRQMRSVTVSDDTISGLLTVRTMYALGISPVVTSDDERYHDLVDEYLLLSKGLREWELTHVNAEHICAISSVAPPRRAVLASNRKSLLRRVKSETTATKDDLRAVLSGDADDSPIYRLYSHLDLRQVDSIARLDPLASQMLSLSALTPVPEPRRTVMKSVKDSLTPIVGSGLAVTLCKAYVDVISEVDGSEFTPSITEPAIKGRKRRTADFSNWHAVTQGMVDEGHLALGETPEDILTDVGRRARTASIERASRLGARQSA